MNWGMKSSQDASGSCRWTQRSFHTRSGPTRADSQSPTPLRPTVQDIGFIPFQQPCCPAVQGAGSQGSWAISSQPTPNSAPRLLCWLPWERTYPEGCCGATRSRCAVGLDQLSVPFQSWDPSPRGTPSFCCLGPSARLLPSRVLDGSSTNVSPA